MKFVQAHGGPHGICALCFPLSLKGWVKEKNFMTQGLISNITEEVVG